MAKLKGSEVDTAIVAARGAGRTLDEIGQAFGMTRQAVHARLKRLTAPEKKPKRVRDDSLAVAALLQRTNRLLAGVIVRICALQTTRREYPFEVLTGLGLTAREIAEATGTTEAVVNVTKTRARRSRATSTEDQLVSTEETVQ